MQDHQLLEIQVDLVVEAENKVQQELAILHLLAHHKEIMVVQGQEVLVAAVVEAQVPEEVVEAVVQDQEELE
tara:strand:- start:229 stop:444 length:216 start_codon:yes stop_codon:yes gene_type:complete